MEAELIKLSKWGHDVLEKSVVDDAEELLVPAIEALDAIYHLLTDKDPDRYVGHAEREA